MTKYNFCWMGWYLVSCLFKNSESRLTDTWACSIFLWLQCRLCQTCRNKVQACWQWIMAITLFLKKLNCNDTENNVDLYDHTFIVFFHHADISKYSCTVMRHPWSNFYHGIIIMHCFINWCHIFVSIANCMCKQTIHQNTSWMLNKIIPGSEFSHHIFVALLNVLKAIGKTIVS